MKKQILLIPFSILIAIPAFADFGEIDILVRDSVEDFFDYEGRDVDLKTLKYDQEPEATEGVLKVQTTVQAVEGFTHKWGLHVCTTLIKILAPGQYQDQGTECSFDLDH